MSAAPQRRGSWAKRAWHERLRPTRAVSGVQRVPDTAVTEVDAHDWLGGEGRDPLVSAELRAEAFVRANRGLLREFAIDSDVRRAAGRPVVRLATSARAGALPLMSPVSGRPDLGLVIEPRFRWSSIGEVLAGTGMRITPELLPLPELPKSERRVPPWVLSSIVLRRIESLLDRLNRRFVLHSADLRAPRGQVDWNSYARLRVPVGKATEVPCTFPDLRDDLFLKSAVHHVLRVHREALLGQRSSGVVVRELLALCDTLLVRVAGCVPRAPTGRLLDQWHRTPISSRVFREGLQAIEWTVDERGLAGVSELSGLSWRLDLQVFFETWVETIANHLARSIGGRVRSGRQEQTRIPISWTPSWTGSQKSLLPDVVLQHDGLTVVFDAKYKAHAEELNIGGWRRADDILREHHRADLLQVLAYAGLFDSARVVACLVYPCRPETWESLRQRGRLVIRARVPAGDRQVELALAAVPMAFSAAAAATELGELIRAPLA